MAVDPDPIKKDPFPHPQFLFVGFQIRLPMQLQENDEAFVVVKAEVLLQTKQENELFDGTIADPCPQSQYPSELHCKVRILQEQVLFKVLTSLNVV